MSSKKQNLDVETLKWLGHAIGDRLGRWYSRRFLGIEDTPEPAGLSEQIGEVLGAAIGAAFGAHMGGAFGALFDGVPTKETLENVGRSVLEKLQDRECEFCAWCGLPCDHTLDPRDHMAPCGRDGLIFCGTLCSMTHGEAARSGRERCQAMPRNPGSPQCMLLVGDNGAAGHLKGHHVNRYGAWTDDGKCKCRQCTPPLWPGDVRHPRPDASSPDDASTDPGSCARCGESDPARKGGRCQNVPGSEHDWRKPQESVEAPQAPMSERRSR